MAESEEAWAAQMLYGPEPATAPPAQLLTEKEELETPSSAETVGRASTTSEPGKDPAVAPSLADVNAGAKKTAVVFGVALLCAIAVIVAALVTFSDTTSDSAPQATQTLVAAAPAPTTMPAAPDQDRAIPY